MSKLTLVDELLGNYRASDLDWEEEDDESLTWPTLPKKLRDVFTEKFEKMITDKPMTSNETIECLLGIGFENDQILAFVNVYEQERILNQEKKLEFNWSKFKDLLGNLCIDILQKRVDPSDEVDYEAEMEEFRKMSVDMKRMFE
jgi:hypothetical protein